MAGSRTLVTRRGCALERISSERGRPTSVDRISITAVVLVLLSLSAPAAAAEPQSDSSGHFAALSEVDKLVAPDADDSTSFGNAVAIDGDWMVVGAHEAYPDCLGPCDQGSAYLFRRIGGVWRPDMFLMGFDVDRNDFFGDAVAVSGDLVAIGAPNYDLGGHRSEGESEGGDEDDHFGAVYLFEGGMEVAKLEPSDAVRHDNFGLSLALAGDTLFVGSAGPLLDMGSVYVFERDPMTGEWIEQQKLLVPGIPVAWDSYGDSIAFSEGTLLVGAFRRNESDGAVYAYEQNPAGEWEFVEELIPSEPGGFGKAIAMYGDTAIIGGGASRSRAGAAYIFERRPEGWQQVAHLVEETLDWFDYFGFSVGIWGDYAVVGAWGAYDYSGAAFLYHRFAGTSGWGKVADLVASDNELSDLFGGAVAIGPATVAVGAVWDDDFCNGQTQYCQSGAIYVFEH